MTSTQPLTLDTAGRMSTFEIANERFIDLRAVAGLGTTGRYEVRSNGLTGRYNVVGMTDDVRIACDSPDVLAALAVPCETFTAHEALR